MDLEELVKRSDRLKLVRVVAERHRYLHWELEFADVFENGADSISYWEIRLG